MAEKALRVGLLAVDGCMLSSLAGPIDTLRVAQILSDIRAPAGGTRFESTIIGARGEGSVRTSEGLVLSGVQSPDRPLDIVLVPGLGFGNEKVETRMSTLGPEVELLRSLHLRGVRLAGCCTGTFLLAQTGLLDGRRATTAWFMAAPFRRHFPRVQLEADAMVVDDGDIVTTGASTAMFGLLSKLIAEAAGEDLAMQTSRMLLVDAERQSQAPYVTQALIEKPRHSLSERAQKFLGKQLHQDISVSQLADHCGVSERSLLRHFKEHFGQSPLAYIQHLRVERAKALLEATHLSFDEVVERCGYTDVPSFRKLFKRETTLTPADYRQRFSLRSR
jgi:transcriptional regulator GlxA family with amidase domain